MVSFESFSLVSSPHLPLICLGDQAFFILERIYFSSSPQGSMRQYLRLARDLLFFRRRYTWCGSICGFLFQSSRYIFSQDFHQIYWNFFCLYSIPLFWKRRYNVLLLRESFVAIWGIEYPSTSNTRISWSSPRDICFFPVIIPPSYQINYNSSYM